MLTGFTCSEKRLQGYFPPVQRKKVILWGKVKFWPSLLRLSTFTGRKKKSAQKNHFIYFQLYSRHSLLAEKLYSFSKCLLRDSYTQRWKPTPVFLYGEFHGQRSLVGYSPWGLKELDMTEWLTLSLSYIYNIQYTKSTLTRMGIYFEP